MAFCFFGMAVSLLVTIPLFFIKGSRFSPIGYFLLACLNGAAGFVMAYFYVIGSWAGLFVNGIVVGTGDLSELALGWATYNGDHMSMYGVNASIPKTLVKHLVEWCADNHFGDGGKDGTGSTRAILHDIADTPISPELLPADENGDISQKTEDIVGPYSLHDFFLYNFFRNGYDPDKIYFLANKAFAGIYSADIVKKWLKTFIRRFFSQQFKRSCLPDGPKVGTVSLSPRGDWRMPSDASCSIFLKDVEKS